MATATYTKLKSGEWGIRVPSESVHKGATFVVTKKDGGTKTETIAAVVWHGNGISLCAIERGGRDSGGNSIRNGASYRAGVTAPHGRTCPICGSRECAKAWDPRDLCDMD